MSTDLFGNLLKAMRPLMAIKHALLDADPFVEREVKQLSQKVMNGRRKQACDILVIVNK